MISKRKICKLLVIGFCVLFLGQTTPILCFAEESTNFETFSNPVIIAGMENEELSKDGKNLFFNSQDSFMMIDSLNVSEDNISINGSIENDDTFHILGKIYKADSEGKDYVVLGEDYNNNYDIAYLAFESTDAAIDLLTQDISRKGDNNYVLKIYLMRKNTRHIYIYEYFCKLDGFNTSNMADPICTMWFKNIVEPEIETECPMPYGETSLKRIEEYRTETYWLGDRWTRTGYKVYVLTVVDEGLRGPGEIHSNLQFERIAESNYPAYQAKEWAGYRLQNAKCKYEVNSGYFIKEISCAGQTASTAIGTADIAVTIGFGVAGASVNLSLGLEEVDGHFGEYVFLPNRADLYPKMVTTDVFPNSLSIEEDSYTARVRTTNIDSCSNYVDDISVTWTYDIYEKNAFAIYTEKECGISKTLTYSFN